MTKYTYVGESNPDLCFVLARVIREVEGKKPQCNHVKWGVGDSENCGLFSLVCGLRPPIVKFLLRRIVVSKGASQATFNDLIDNLISLMQSISWVNDKKTIKLNDADLTEYLESIKAERRNTMIYPDSDTNIIKIGCDEHPNISLTRYNKRLINMVSYDFGNSLTEEMLKNDFPLIFLLGKKISYSTKQYRIMKESIAPILNSFVVMSKT